MKFETKVKNKKKLKIEIRDTKVMVGEVEEEEKEWMKDREEEVEKEGTIGQRRGSTSFQPSSRMCSIITRHSSRLQDLLFFLPSTDA